MRIRYYLIISFLFCSLTSNAQESDSTWKKMDLSLTYSFLQYSNLSNPTGPLYYSFQVLNTVYPFSYKSSQFGVGFGYEYIKTNEYSINQDTAVQFLENRIPLLFSYKLRFSKTVFTYFKYQFGTSLVLTSETQIKDGDLLEATREQIGLPLLMQMAIGIQMYEGKKFDAGIELGYAYKQLGYKAEPQINPSSISFGLVANF